MHQAATGSAGVEVVPGVFALPVHQTVLNGTDIGLVLFQGNAVLSLHQAVEVGGLLLATQRVLHLRGRSALPGGVDEGEQGVVAHFLNEGEGVLKLRGGLAGEAHDDVAGEHHVGNPLPERLHLVQVLLPGVAAVHGTQYPGVAGLEGQMDAGGHLLALGHHVKEPLGGILGVAGHEAEQKLPFDGVGLLQQGGKVHAGAQVLAVGIHVLAQQGDVLVPFRHQLANLTQNDFRLSAALPTPGVGHNAVGAEVVAAIHDGHPGLDFAGAAHGQALSNGPFGGGGLKDTAPAQVDAAHELREAPQHLRAKHQVHMLVGLAQPLHHVGLLGHAAAQADDLVGVAPLAVDQGAHVAEHPLLGVLSDGAGVDEDEVGVFAVVDNLIAHLAQHAPQQLRVRLVLLAPVGVHKGGGSLGVLGVDGPDFLTIFPLFCHVLSGDDGGRSLHGEFLQYS